MCLECGVPLVPRIELSLIFQWFLSIKKNLVGVPSFGRCPLLGEILDLPIGRGQQLQVIFACQNFFANVQCYIWLQTVLLKLSRCHICASFWLNKTRRILQRSTHFGIPCICILRSQNSGQWLSMEKLFSSFWK